MLIFCNIFCIFVFAKQNDNTEIKQEVVNTVPTPIQDGQCGNPVNNYVRINCGCVTKIDKDSNLLTVVDEDGEEWLVEVGNTDEFSVDYYYCIFYDKMGTDTIYDDEIIKLWREVW